MVGALLREMIFTSLGEFLLNSAENKSDFLTISHVYPPVRKSTFFPFVLCSIQHSLFPVSCKSSPTSLWERKVVLWRLPPSPRGCVVCQTSQDMTNPLGRKVATFLVSNFTGYHPPIQEGIATLFLNPSLMKK